LDFDRYQKVDGGAPVFERQICFVGGLDWAPNEDGLRWFVQQVLPKIKSESTDAGLAVLARGAEERPWLYDDPFIRVLPPEMAAPELFASSQVSIAPLFQGGGVRIKIPESLAVGCPVVATRVGAEGHDLPGLTQTDDPTAFAKACLRHLYQGEGSLSRPALHQGVDTRYGATAAAERLVDLWSQTITLHGSTNESSQALR
jgi:glycosyltransferase involved in cell wall biosynthesis